MVVSTPNWLAAIRPAIAKITALAIIGTRLRVEADAWPRLRSSAVAAKLDTTLAAIRTMAADNARGT